MWAWIRRLREPACKAKPDTSGAVAQAPIAGNSTEPSSPQDDQHSDVLPTPYHGAATPQNLPAIQESLREPQQDFAAVPNLQDKSSAAMHAASGHSGQSTGRYICSGGQPVGIANTVKKYQESQPVLAHTTPFEVRVEAKMAEEEEVRESLQEDSGSTVKQLFSHALEAQAVA